MNRPWKLVVLLLGIYIAGGVTGAFVMRRVGREMGPHRPMPEQWASMQLKRLGERLDLKPEQVEQIQPIVRRNMEELRRLRSKDLAETRTLFERMQREIAEKLTPEQRAKFEQMNSEFRERAKKFMQERQNRPPGGPGGPRFERDRERPAGDSGQPPGVPPPEKPTGG
jgi:uncharacterized membrane protein